MSLGDLDILDFSNIHFLVYIKSYRLERRENILIEYFHGICSINASISNMNKKLIPLCFFGIKISL